jgi:hypothetical protein
MFMCMYTEHQYVHTALRTRTASDVGVERGHAVALAEPRHAQRASNMPHALQRPAARAPELQPARARAQRPRRRGVRDHVQPRAVPRVERLEVRRERRLPAHRLARALRRARTAPPALRRARPFRPPRGAFLAGGRQPPRRGPDRVILKRPGHRACVERAVARGRARVAPPLQEQLPGAELRDEPLRERRERRGRRR